MDGCATALPLDGPATGPGTCGEAGATNHAAGGDDHCEAGPTEGRGGVMGGSTLNECGRGEGHAYAGGGANGVGTGGNKLENTHGGTGIGWGYDGT